MGKTAGIKVCSCHICPCDVLSAVYGKTQLSAGHKIVFEIIEPVEHMEHWPDLGISPDLQICLRKRCAKRTRILGEGRRHEHRRLQVLLCVLRIHKVEEPVLDNRAA